MAIPTRDKSLGNGLGGQRWRRYADAFDRVERCASQGYFLEAIAILDSLIGDRLASRLGHLQGDDSIKVEPIGRLCGALIGYKNAPGVEHDPEFRAVTADIRVWSETRNDAMHGVARIFRPEDTATSFDAAMNIHGQTVLDGIAVLRRFDRLDTAARQARKDIPAHKRFPATWPAAFFPEERSGTPRPVESDAR